MISQSHELLINSKSEILRALDELDSTSMFSSQLSDAIESINSANVEKLGSIVVIGCGGTGSWLLPKLIKTINDAKRKDLLTSRFKLVLVDADKIEDKNLVRQNFIGPEIGINKAEVMATRYGPHLDSSIEVIYYDKYVASRDQINSKPEEEKEFFMDVSQIFEYTADVEPRRYDKNRSRMSCVVFNLVDNSKARQALHGYLNSLSRDTEGNAKFFSNIYAVDTGNDMYNGQYHVSSYSTNAIGMRLQSLKNLSAGAVSIHDIAWNTSCIATNIKNSNNFFDFSPETIEATDDVSLYSCAEADVDIDNQDQMLVANDFAATLCHNWLVSYMLSLLQTSTIVIPPSDATFICGSRSVMNSFGGIPNDTYIELYLISKMAIFNTDLALNSFKDTKFNSRFDRADTIFRIEDHFQGLLSSTIGSYGNWYNGGSSKVDTVTRKFFSEKIDQKSREEITATVKESAIKLLQFIEETISEKNLSVEEYVNIASTEPTGISAIFCATDKNKLISDYDIIIYHLIISLLIIMGNSNNRVTTNIANMIVVLNLIVTLN